MAKDILGREIEVNDLISITTSTNSRMVVGVCTGVYRYEDFIYYGFLATIDGYKYVDNINDLKDISKLRIGYRTKCVTTNSRVIILRRNYWNTDG